MTSGIEGFPARVAEAAELPLEQRQAALDALYEELQAHLDGSTPAP